jgi:AcrR family transcriptional regulator
MEESVKKVEATANGVVKDSRRTRYTKKALRESLVELMKSKSIVRITIKELCDLADVSRSTFYAYYKDQYDLLKQIEEETISYFEDILKRFDKRRCIREISQMVEEIVRNIADNSDSIQALLSENGDIRFQEEFFRRFIRKLHLVDSFIEPRLSDIPGIEEYYLIYIVNGSIALVQHWLKNNMDIPIPRLADMLIHLSPAKNKMASRAAQTAP